VRKKLITLLVITILLIVTIFPMMASAYATSYYLSVPILNQGTADICWACSTASAIEYIDNSSIPSVATLEAEVGLYGAAPWSDVAYLLSYWGASYNSATSKPSFATAEASIASGEPVIVLCYSGSNVGHVVELRGYAAGSNPTVSYMDSNYTAYQVQYYSTFSLINGYPIQDAEYNIHS
jgi:hypothetical protein